MGMKLERKKYLGKKFFILLPFNLDVKFLTKFISFSAYRTKNKLRLNKHNATSTFKKDQIFDLKDWNISNSLTVQYNIEFYWVVSRSVAEKKKRKRKLVPTFPIRRYSFLSLDEQINFHRETIEWL